MIVSIDCVVTEGICMVWLFLVLKFIWHMSDHPFMEFFKSSWRATVSAGLGMFL